MSDSLIDSTNSAIALLERLQEKLKAELKKIGDDKEDKKEFFCGLRRLRYLLFSLSSTVNDILINEE